jgi:hypothetical protein
MEIKILKRDSEDKSTRLKESKAVLKEYEAKVKELTMTNEKLKIISKTTNNGINDMISL